MHSFYIQYLLIIYFLQRFKCTEFQIEGCVCKGAIDTGEPATKNSLALLVSARINKTNSCESIIELQVEKLV